MKRLPQTFLIIAMLIQLAVNAMALEITLSSSMNSTSGSFVAAQVADHSDHEPGAGLDSAPTMDCCDTKTGDSCCDGEPCGDQHMSCGGNCSSLSSPASTLIQHLFVFRFPAAGQQTPKLESPPPLPTYEPPLRPPAAA